VTAGALALADSPLLGLRGPRVQIFGAGGCRLGGGGGLGGSPAQNVGFWTQFLRLGSVGICLLTVTGGIVTETASAFSAVEPLPGPAAAVSDCSRSHFSHLTHEGVLVRDGCLHR
jgi:hypothetical protein